MTEPSTKPYSPEIFQYAFIGTRETIISKLEYLANLAMKEEWNFSNTWDVYSILRSYILYTFNKVKEEWKLLELWDYSSMNTWLVTENQEEIFMLFEKNKIQWPGKPPWYFKSFHKESDIEMCAFPTLPKRANYFENPSDLIYDSNMRLVVNYEHIIEDNLDRFPEEFQKNSMKTQILKWAIDMALKRVSRNYKIAVPQYSKWRIQLLLPICLTALNKADLALVVSKVIESNGTVYKAFTCLTLDMAINNARLICKPDMEWLKPQ